MQAIDILKARALTVAANDNQQNIGAAMVAAAKAGEGNKMRQIACLVIAVMHNCPYSVCVPPTPCQKCPGSNG